MDLRDDSVTARSGRSGGGDRQPDSDALELDRRAVSVMDAMADPVVALGPDTRLLYANRAAEARFGWSLEDLLGRDMTHLAHPDDLETALYSLASVLEKETGTLVEIRLRDRAGEWSRFEIRGRAWADGPVEGAVVINLRETADRHGWDVAGGDVDMLGTVLEHLPIVTLVTDETGRVRGSNRAVSRVLHQSVEETRDRQFLDLVAPDERTRVGTVLQDLAGTSGTSQLETTLVDVDGIPRPVHLVAVDLTTDRTVRGLVLVAHDISALVSARAELRRLAEHDDLTGLPNRSRVREHLAGIVDSDAGPHTVLFGDVDGLKRVNDTHGHAAGDAALVAVATRLQQVVRPDDLVARLGGDEFVLVLATGDPATVTAVQRRIDALMSAPIVLPEGHLVTLGISIGVAPVQASITADELLASADAAMYVSKRERAADST